MTKGRLEAFSDGVFAVIITIMVLEPKAPHATDLEAFRPLLPGFLTYVLSYVLLGIYLCGIPLAFVRPWIADAIYASVALMWLVPDSRIERRP